MINSTRMLQSHPRNDIRLKISLCLCMALALVFIAQSHAQSSKLAYKAYWIEIYNNDLDKPALPSHLSVLRYHARKTHAVDIEQRINSSKGINNRQLISYLNEIASIYEEHQLARNPRYGVLNPS